jgi:hypothetical protein
MTELTKQQKLIWLDIVIKFIQNHIKDDNTIHYSNLPSCTSNANIMGLCICIKTLVRNETNNTTILSTKFIAMLKSYSPNYRSSRLFWFPAYDFGIRLAFLYHCKKMIKRNSNEKFNGIEYYYNNIDKCNSFNYRYYIEKL